MMSPLPFPEFRWKPTLLKYGLFWLSTKGKCDTVSNHMRAKEQPGYKGKAKKVCWPASSSHQQIAEIQLAHMLSVTSVDWRICGALSPAETPHIWALTAPRACVDCWRWEWPLSTSSLSSWTNRSSSLELEERPAFPPAPQTLIS